MFTLAGIWATVAGAVALVPGGGATVGVIATAAGYVVRCKPCLYAIGVAALCGWTAIHVHRADQATCETRIEADHREAEAARKDRDDDIAGELKEIYQPKIAALAKERADLQNKVKEYEKRKPVAKAGQPGTCKLGAAADVVR